MLHIIKDKDPIWDTDNYDVILLGTNIYCMLGNGFQNKLKNKYPKIEEINDKTNYGDRRKLGKRITIEGEPVISLLYICNYPNKKWASIDYDALENAMATANVEFKGKKVMTTMLGTTIFDGNGDREKVMEILENNCSGMDLYVYDYNQLNKKDEIGAYVNKIKALYKAEPEKYKQLWKSKDEVLKEMFLK